MQLPAPERPASVAKLLIELKDELSARAQLPPTVLRRFRCELQPGHELRTAIVPTLSPRGGLPMVVRER